jgi:hypothetical protein
MRASIIWINGADPALLTALEAKCEAPADANKPPTTWVYGSDEVMEQCCPGYAAWQEQRVENTVRLAGWLHPLSVFSYTTECRGSTASGAGMKGTTDLRCTTTFNVASRF